VAAIVTNQESAIAFDRERASSIVAVWTSGATQGNATVSAQAQLAKLEQTLAGRLGIFAMASSLHRFAF
jgi:hypothetical protein